MIKFDYRRGLFEKGVQTEFSSSFPSDDTKEDDSKHRYGSSYEIRNPYYKKPPMKGNSNSKHHIFFIDRYIEKDEQLHIVRFF